jgi:hypothetical protein
MSASDSDYQKWVVQKYNRLTKIWADGDLWHARMREDIISGVRRVARYQRKPPDLVIDVGSGGLAQDIKCLNYIQVDIACQKLVGARLAICADAQRLPFANGIADQVICVGSVVNYCSLFELVGELSRIAKRGAHIILHAELSNSLELIFSRHFRSNTTFLSTVYQGEERQWLYSRRNIRQALAAVGLRIVEERYFHILSALAQKIIRDRNRAARLTKLDRLIGRLSALGTVADNAVFICERTT